MRLSAIAGLRLRQIDTIGDSGATIFPVPICGLQCVVRQARDQISHNAMDRLSARRDEPLRVLPLRRERRGDR